MREIKFRGKSVDDGSWVYGYYLYTFEIGYNQQGLLDVPHRLHYIFGYAGDFCEVVPETVGQYTGLKDRHGKEIYEGDVVQHVIGWVGKVHYREGTFEIEARHKSWPINYTRSGKIEIAGNIYDNPELLEV